MFWVECELSQSWEFSLPSYLSRGGNFHTLGKVFEGDVGNGVMENLIQSSTIEGLPNFDEEEDLKVSKKITN